MVDNDITSNGIDNNDNDNDDGDGVKSESQSDRVVSKQGGAFPRPSGTTPHPSVYSEYTPLYNTLPL